jgi:hypothetical protein
MGGHHLNAPAAGMALGPDINGGYFEVASDGRVFAFGDAPFLGSMADQHLNAPIVGMAVSETARPGYWLVAADRGVFSFGAAPFLGPLAPTHRECRQWQEQLPASLHITPGPRSPM